MGSNDQERAGEMSGCREGSEVEVGGRAEDEEDV